MGKFNGLWVPPQAERYTEEDLLTAAREIGCEDVKPRTVRTFIELGLLDHPRRYWPGHGGGSSSGWWPRLQFDLWCALLNQRKRIIEREGPKAQISAALCNVVVAAWLYFGEEGGIPLAQVRRAMQTWAKANATVGSDAEARRLAKRFVRMAAHPSATNRRELRERIVKMLLLGQYPDREELLYELGTLVDPHDRGEIKGPAAAPISAVNLTDMILGRAGMLRTLCSGGDISPDGLWEWARFMLLWSRSQHLATQPGLAHDPSLQKYPELAQMYAPEDFEGMVNAACEDLLTVLGASELAQQATHLQPPLHPGPWLAGEMHPKVEGRQQLSEVLHPDGSRQVYLGISVQVTRRSDGQSNSLA